MNKALKSIMLIGGAAFAVFSSSIAIAQTPAQYIGGLSDTAQQKKYLGEFASLLEQAVTLDFGKKAELKKVAARLQTVTTCLQEGTGYQYEDAALKLRDVRRLVLNTEARQLAYDNYGQAIAGMTFKTPKKLVCE